MFCPSCRFPNVPNAEACDHCRYDLKGLRERVSVGQQFLFVDASPRRPVALSLDGRDPRLFNEPTVISRHRHGLGFGEHSVRRGGPGSKAARPKPGVDLPRLPAPAGPDLTAVITERKIYRPREEVHIFVVAPDAAGREVEVEIQLAGQQITKNRVTLDEAGLALRPYADLEEGEYTVLVRRSQTERDGRGPARCTFSVAQFTLSPLIALLEAHTYEAGELSFRLKVVALSVPYDGPIELALQSGERVVETQEAAVRKGAVEASFDVREHEGPFRVQATTPAGETASVFFPGTGRTERERITLCPLGRVAEAGLLPGEDTFEARGLHVSYDGVEVTPLRLEEAVARTARLVADVRAAVVQVVTFHPLTGETALHEWRDVDVGDVFEFPVDAPYTLFTTGSIAPRQPYEAWGVVIHPTDVAARLTAPEKAQPGDEIAVRVETNQPGVCLLLVYDARLEHESPLPKLGRQMMDAVRDGTKKLKEQAAPTLAAVPPWGWGYLQGPVVMRSSAMPTKSMSMDMELAVAGAMPEAPPVAVATEAQPLTFVAVPSREDFPELAYLELFPIERVGEHVVPLGDQIGTWRCRAYLVSGLDVVELTADVETAKAIYAELDLPAIVGQGDDILAGVRYHTQKPATMAITLPGGQTISGLVMGHGSETFHLTEPGEVTVHIFGQEGEDWTMRTVRPPGVQTVTASRLEILKQGETIRGERVIVYPGPADVLKDTIEALGRYPFG